MVDISSCIELQRWTLTRNLRRPQYSAPASAAWWASNVGVGASSGEVGLISRAVGLGKQQWPNVGVDSCEGMSLVNCEEAS